MFEHRIAWVLLSLLIALAGSPLQADCSCTGLRIHTAQDNDATSNYYCVATDSGAPTFIDCTSGGVGAQGCDATETAYRCRLGRVVPADDNVRKPLGWTFEARATVTGTPTDCQSGQLVTNTFFDEGDLVGNPAASDTPAAGDQDFDYGPAVQVVADPSLVPNVGAVSGDRLLFGADSYTIGSGPFIRIDGQTVQWLDDPMTENIEANETYAASREFISYIQGQGYDANDCWCRFMLDYSSTLGDVAEGLTLVSQQRCAFTP